MKYKVRLTATRSYASYTHNFREEHYFHYSDRMQVKSLNKRVEIFASIKDAETLQRLNPQHEVEIYSVHDKCYFPLWFFRRYEDHLQDGQLMACNFYNFVINMKMEYKGMSHPLESQAPKFIYRPSTNFLIKKALYGMYKRGWKPCLGVTTTELVYTWVKVFKEQMNGKYT